MTAQKILQANVNHLNKRLAQRKSNHSPSPYAYVEAERKIVPYDKTALTKQYYLMKELVADYIDKKQVALFDEAIHLFDRANLRKEK